MALSAKVLVGAILLAISSVARAEAPPDLRGIWIAVGGVGAVQGALAHTGSSDEARWASKTVEWTMTIEEQEERGLIGTWGSSQLTETLVGVIRLDNETVLFADEDSLFQGKLLSPSAMELCLQETGGSLAAACFALEKTE